MNVIAENVSQSCKTQSHSHAWGYNKLVSLGAFIAMTGYLLSGPVSYLVIYLIKPQPAWTNAAEFAANYSTIQDLTYYFGYLLVGGMLMLAAGHYLHYTGENKQVKFHLLLSVAWTVVFAALILFNYICQTTFVHNMALRYNAEYDFAITTFSMANPMSFCWANEMWGYAFLGIATMLMSGYYRERNQVIRWLLIINGPVSILSAILTIVDVTWIMTLAGFIAYLVWNVLMIVVTGRIYIYSRTTPE